MDFLARKIYFGLNFAELLPQGTIIQYDKSALVSGNGLVPNREQAITLSQ